MSTADLLVEMEDKVIGPPHSEVLEEEVSDELVLYDAAHETFVALNSSAADVWRMATGEHTIDDIVIRIAASYGVKADEIREQVERTIRELLEAGLLSSPRP